jgi:lysozyme family protein
MPKINLTLALREEYERLFRTCSIRPGRVNAVEQILVKLEANKDRYLGVSKYLKIPWAFIAVIHNMESSQNFTRHLHNGDPLTRRTVQVPAGRPKKGNPPFTWEESAIDALSMKGLGEKTDWSIAGTLYQLERYNGWGYRLYHSHVLSPYLWGFSNHYTSGKYVADGRWSDTAVSKQCGAAVLLRRMTENGIFEFPDQPIPAVDTKPLIFSYSVKKTPDTNLLMLIQETQRWLNTFPGIFIKDDGIPGEKTSEAYKKVTGNYLPGDPRG